MAIKDEWEQNINRFIKSDSRKRFQYLTPPVQEAMHALDQIKAVHGHSPMETHGLVGIRFISTFPPGMEKWDKNYEYRIWLKNSLLHEETSFHPEKKMGEHEWMAVEAYALEDIKIKEDIVYKGNLFRKSYTGCSERMGCIKRDSEPEDHSGHSMNINNACRQKCQDEAAKETSFFTKAEVEHFRKADETMV